MKDIEIGIIGGTGGIGRWFAAFFRAEGYTVHVAGRTTETTVTQLADRCRVVIVAVPIAATVEVIRRVGPLLGAGALLMDLTSFKTEPVRAMLDATVADVLGCHPLFGPDVQGLKDQNVVLCPGRGERGRTWFRELLRKNGAGVVETTPERHDRMMALVQGLNHLNTMALGLTLREAGVSPEELAPFSTPIFRTKTTILEKVFGSNPRLYAELVASNPDVAGLLDLYERNVARLKALVAGKDVDGLTDLIGAG
jgi:prephenate dehydrogenase